MTLNFPNRSRSYDSTRRAVRFWGHDNMRETAFCVTAVVLQRVRPGTLSDEAGLLDAFDANRDAIHAAAVRAYGRGRKGSYELAVVDF